MAKMTFELIPLTEVETGPVDYGFDWVNVGRNNTLWAHNPITEAVTSGQSYTRPHTSSEGWLFDFRLRISETTDTFTECKPDETQLFYLTYGFPDDNTDGAYTVHDGTNLLKSLNLSTTNNKIAEGQILLDVNFIKEMFKFTTFDSNVLSLPKIDFLIFAKWTTTTGNIIRLSNSCTFSDFTLFGKTGDFRAESMTLTVNVKDGVSSVYQFTPNGLADTLFDPGIISFKYELIKGYNYNTSNFFSKIKVTSPFKLKNTITVGDYLFTYLKPSSSSGDIQYGTITKKLSDTELELTIGGTFDAVYHTDNTLSLMSNIYLMYDTNNASEQYSFRILPKSSATIEQSKTSLKAVEFIESNENQIAFQRGGRVWCKELIENSYEENIEFHKNAKISPNLITSLNGTGYDPEQEYPDIYITIDNTTNTALSVMPAPSTHIAFSYNLVKGLKVTLPNKSNAVFNCSGLPYNSSDVIQGKTPELEFVFYKSGIKKLTLSTIDNWGGATAGLLDETGDYTVDVNLVYPQYGRNPSGVYWDLTISPQIEVQIWENGQAQVPSPFSKYGTILSKDYYIQAKEFKE